MLAQMKPKARGEILGNAVVLSKKNRGAIKHT